MDKSNSSTINIVGTETENYIERIKRLAATNKNLKERFFELADRFSAIEEQNLVYQKQLLKFSPESEMVQNKESRKTARRLRMVSILYVGISGFDKLYRVANPSQMIDLLDEIKHKVEDITFRHNVLPIRTLGDTTLYGAGIQVESKTNAIDILQIAMEIRHLANVIKKENPTSIWTIKLAVHTGSVLAIPEKKDHPTFSFSGENINITVRLGESSDGSGIVTSAMTYELIKEFFEGNMIGTMPAKYIGDLHVYNINNWIPFFRDKENSFLPNHNFIIKYGHIKYMDLENEILDYLEHNLPKNLYYHNVKHTIDVITEVELIGWAEGISEEELLVLKIAALFHDAGHIINYENHEYHSAVMAREKMASYDFPEEYIDQVCKLIMATKLPPRPNNILEQIMCDSDLDYLGRTDFLPISNNLYEELKERNLIDSFNDWNKRQLDFIKNHQYFTKTAIKLREVNKQKQIKRLKKIIV